MERDPVLDRAEEGGGGLECKGPTEVREEGPEEWVVTYGQWVTEVYLEHSSMEGHPKLWVRPLEEGGG